MENNITTDLPEFSDFVGLKTKKKKTSKFPKNSFQLASPKEDLNQNPLLEITKGVPDTITKQASSVDAAEPLEDDLSFDNMKKKRKKKVLDIDEVVSTTSKEGASPLAPLLDSEGDDYTYEYLLVRIYSLMREKDPNRDLESKKKLVMKPPQVIRIGTKKTSFVNFLEICKLMHRTPNHLQSFLLAELGTTASVDGNNQLIIKGRFEQRQIESVLRRYIKEYVTCHTCKSPDTVLQKDTRLFFLQCESCGSRCSVASVKSGFQAVTGKRAAMRAKTT